MNASTLRSMLDGMRTCLRIARFRLLRMCLNHKKMYRKMFLAARAGVIAWPGVAFLFMPTRKMKGISPYYDKNTCQYVK